jgi:hypothetical protein
MFINTQGQSDIVIHKTNIWNKVYLCKQTFFYKCSHSFCQLAILST